MILAYPCWYPEFTTYAGTDVRCHGFWTTPKYNRSKEHMTKSSRTALLRYVAGAVTEAAVEDLRVNLFSYAAFPQIQVSSQPKDVFEITLSWKTCQTQFQLMDAEAKAAVKTFRSGTGFERSVFDKVQAALATPDGKAQRVV